MKTDYRRWKFRPLIYRQIPLSQSLDGNQESDQLERLTSSSCMQRNLFLCFFFTTIISISKSVQAQQSSPTLLNSVINDFDSYHEEISDNYNATHILNEKNYSADFTSSNLVNDQETTTVKTSKYQPTGDLDNISLSSFVNNTLIINDSEDLVSQNSVNLQHSPFEDQIILRLNISSTSISNCSDVEFVCEILSASLKYDSNVLWWKFRNRNISSTALPGGHVINRDQPQSSVLNIECAQFGVHDGNYQCFSSSNVSGSNPIVKNSSEVHLDISVLMLEAIDSTNRTVKQVIDSSLQLRCHALGFPKPRIVWQRYDPHTLIGTDIEQDGRIEIEDQFLPDEPSLNPSKPLKSYQSTLRIETLKRSDNGTYICRAIGQKSEKPKIQEYNVIVLEVPEIHIEKIEIENKTTALISFLVDFDGNLPIDRYILEFRNYSAIDSDWIALDSRVVGTKQQYFTLKVTNLVHAANYGFRLAAANNLIGQSSWSSMNISVPSYVPDTIDTVHLLSKTNETLLFGWKRPLHDNGAEITQFIQILKDHNDDLIWNQTINNVQSRNKHMSLFSNLQPGSQYFFQIRACSIIGCGRWSTPFQAITSDGYADPPTNILLECQFDSTTGETNATIYWDQPNNPRGLIIGYNLTLIGHSTYHRDQRIMESFEQSYQITGNETLQFTEILKPNTNYTVRVCAINKSGCGKLSHLTSNSMCQTSPSVPSEFPDGIRLERIRASPSRSNSYSNKHLSDVFYLPNSDSQERHVSPFHNERQLKLFVPKISERNGPFLCIRIFVIRLPDPISNFNVIQIHENDTKNSNYSNSSSNLSTNKSDSFGNYLDDKHSISISTYSMVHAEKKNSFGAAYIAKEFTSDNLPSEIIIGDGKQQRCYKDAMEYDLKSRVKHPGNDSRLPRRINYNHNNDTLENSGEDININLVEDRELLPNTYYSAAVEVTVMAINHTLLSELSPWAEPILTEPIQSIITKSSYSFSETTAEIVYAIFCGLILILILFIILYLIKRKKSETIPVLLEDERIGLSSFIWRAIGQKYKSPVFHQLNFNSTDSIRKWASKPIPIRNLNAVFEQRHKNSDFLFQAEFESLPESFSNRTTLASDSPENIGKNRYPDIKSYDQTRVLLKKIDDVPGSDYINADFVTVKPDDRRFICAQGPIQKTVQDFWRMIYEQNSRIIVMLTGLEEQGRIKCAPYWSENLSEPFRLENFDISTEYIRECSDYVMRKFILKIQSTDEYREVLHFHFIAWRDFLAPDQPSRLLRFLKRVNENYRSTDGPVVVHCSAGVGRTGTFIAIDSLIRKINYGTTEIDIYDLVSKLRHQRNFLVQSLRQYVFIYRAIIEYISFGDTEIDGCEFRQRYYEMKTTRDDLGDELSSEFEKLEENIDEQKSTIVGSLDINRAKNRCQSILPYDINRVILNPSHDTCYINASFIQGYDNTLPFIVAQDPLEKTTNEFWWMIVEHSVRIVVMLSDLDDGPNGCHLYWPSNIETFDCDFVKVKRIEEEISQHFIRRVFVVTRKKTKKNETVIQIQFKAWKFGSFVPESTSSFIELIDLVLSLHHNQNDKNNNGNKNSYDIKTSPILVHCFNGGDRSSVLVAFVSLVRQILMEKKVDVFQTVRNIRFQRSGMLQHVVQFDFLHRCLIDYMNHHEICMESNGGDVQL
ncbi:Tyrosine-protein phosphatase 69D [Sarcoptes scabiei]|uniref:protein-tyrosine-phosphatase n=1 Tax=Sarcoptes scabiei TaxID=52283 RepID=A0A834VIV6_SARSC|nr:Tyrosine-protein phosphatase 69D [Sarcoptes scabiei]